MILTKNSVTTDFEYLLDDLKIVGKKYNYKVSCIGEGFYVYKIIKNDYLDFNEGIFIQEFPSNCAWIVLHDFVDMKSFDTWLSFSIEVAKYGDYSGIMFSLSDYQLKFLPDLTKCIRLCSQYNAHSWDTVHLYLYPLKKVD